MARKARRSQLPAALSASPPGARPGAPLSERQNQILRLIALGKSNKEIADQLGLTTGTIKQHVYALFRKLGVRNRTTAVARGADAVRRSAYADEFPGPGAAVPGVAAQAPASDILRYARRLVTAVVIEPRPDPTRSSREEAEAVSRIAPLRSRIERLAFAFDARPEFLPGGGIAAWFGLPVAHGDDAERAVAFVRALQRHAIAEKGMPSAAGVGTAAEVVGEGERDSIAYRTFRTATLLASLAEPGAPLACELTSELAGLPQPATPGRDSAGAQRPLPEGARVIGAARPRSADVAQQWGGLPFVSDLVASVRRGRCQWLAIESWPPEAGTWLIDAIGAVLAANGLPVRDLWMPSQTNRAEAARRLIGQLGEGFPASGLMRAPSVLRDALVALPSTGPRVLLAYGIDALQMLKAAIGEAGLERLRTVPLIIVAGAMHRTGAPQTVVRLLGSHPGASPFVRVLRMQVPAERPRSLQGIRPDVQAVLDAVSAEARAIARVAANPGSCSVSAVAQALSMAIDAVIERCREFESSGLLSLHGERLEFRDETTAAAVRATLA